MERFGGLSTAKPSSAGHKLNYRLGPYTMYKTVEMLLFSTPEILVHGLTKMDDCFECEANKSWLNEVNTKGRGL